MRYELRLKKQFRIEYIAKPIVNIQYRCSINISIVNLPAYDKSLIDCKSPRL